VGIRVDDAIRHYFHTLKGLRQGDSLSPILYNIVTDMLAILTCKRGWTSWSLTPHLVDGGISILHYADDTILFMEHDLVKSRKHEVYSSFFKATIRFENQFS
jgi:hypothetical protein